MAQTPPFDTKTSVSNPCRLPTYSDKPQVPQNPHPLTPRLQFLIPVGCQPTAPHKHLETKTSVSTGCQHTAPDKPYVAQTPPFDTKTTYGTVQAPQAPCGPNPHPLTPRLQFLIPVGCQSTAPNKPKPTPFDTNTSVSTGCHYKAPNKPYVAQTPTLWYQDYLRHRTSRASPTWPKPPPFHTKTSVSNPCRLPTYSDSPTWPKTPTLWHRDFSFYRLPT